MTGRRRLRPSGGMGRGGPEWLGCMVTKMLGGLRLLVSVGSNWCLGPVESGRWL